MRNEGMSQQTEHGVMLHGMDDNESIEQRDEAVE
jgi:hypothetical protein